MLMFDHGMPAADGQVSPWQRPEADINIEFQVNSARLADSQKLAWFFKDANFLYATDYPANVGQRMQNTDSVSFMNDAPAISIRENERRDVIGVRLEPSLAPRDGRLHDLFRQGLPPRPERRADDARGRRAAGRRPVDQVISSPPRNRRTLFMRVTVNSFDVPRPWPRR